MSMRRSRSHSAVSAHDIKFTVPRNDGLFEGPVPPQSQSLHPAFMRSRSQSGATGPGCGRSNSCHSDSRHRGPFWERFAKSNRDHCGTKKPTSSENGSLPSQFNVPSQETQYNPALASHRASCLNRANQSRCATNSRYAPPSSWVGSHRYPPVTGQPASGTPHVACAKPRSCASRMSQANPSGSAGLGNPPSGDLHQTSGHEMQKHTMKKSISGPPTVGPGAQGDRSHAHSGKEVELSSPSNSGCHCDFSVHVAVPDCKYAAPDVKVIRSYGNVHLGIAPDRYPTHGPIKYVYHTSGRRSHTNGLYPWRFRLELVIEKD